MSETAKNVLGTELKHCCQSPMTGYFRNGKCYTAGDDLGLHIVCAQMTDEFLAFSKSRGNDLSSPNPEIDFPGLVAGDKWCLCAMRWVEAYQAGMAPPVDLEATHLFALEHIPLSVLKSHALPLSQN